MRPRGFTLVEVVVVILLCALLAAILIRILPKRDEEEHLVICASNLKHIGLALKMYATEHKGKWPPVDDRRNNLFFDANTLVPEYIHMGLFDVFHCPARDGEPPTAAAEVDDESYFYLGWLVLTEAEGLKALAMYEALDLRERDKAIDVSVNQGTWGSDHLWRLRDGLAFIGHGRYEPRADAIAAGADNPAMWERPGSHKPAGGHVLYMDGHIEYVPYPGKFPMTEAFIKRCEQISARKEVD